MYCSLNNFFITLITTSGIEKKLWPSRQGFLNNSLRSKLHISVAFAHVQMTYFESKSDQLDQYKDQFFGILKWLISFSSQGHSATLMFFKIYWKKEVYLFHFLFLMKSSTKWFLASKLCASLVSQTITSPIIIILQWILLVKISTADHVCNLRY